MNVFIKTSISLLCIAGLVGCGNAGPKETGGQLLGGAAGALLGAQFGKGTGRLVGVAIGALAGSYLGGRVGHQLDQKDQEMARHTMSNTLEHSPDHEVHTWHNPNTNHSGNIQVTRTQEIPNQNLVCRDYVHTVTIDGEQEKVHGRACRDIRDPKAMWTVQS